MEGLKIFNHLTNELESFVPKDPNDVKIYVCGPTVYDSPHLGHGRTYVFVDCLTRILQHVFGYHVRLVMNITDLDSKIIERGGHDVAVHNERKFFEAMDKLNVKRPDFVSRVTDFMNTISHFVENNLNGYSYRSSDLLFDIKPYLKRYGPVFRANENRLDPVLENSYKSQKKDSRDFVLWKADKVWVDAEGKERQGMPGWHSECAAISTHHFGDYIDIHLGGIDLKFPHHENEIALGRVHLQKHQWIGYCLYVGHLEIKGRKMSKSLKNFITIDEILKSFSPLALRYLFLKYKYMQPMEYTEEKIVQAQKSYDKLMKRIEWLEQYIFERKQDTFFLLEELCRLNQVKEEVSNALKDNFNTSKALEIIENFVSYLYLEGKECMHNQSLQYCLKYISYVIDELFGLKSAKQASDSNKLLQLIKNFRSEVRNNALQHMLKKCDKVRTELNNMGYLIEDY